MASTFEIMIQRGQAGRWPVEIKWVVDGACPVQDKGVFNVSWPEFEEHLRTSSLDPHAYGTLLGEALFVGAIERVFARARGAVASESPLHVLVSVDADELRPLRWERLCAPLDDRWDFLSLNQWTPFSLYLPSTCSTQFMTSGRQGLRALILAASPKGLDHYRLDAFDVTEAVAGVRAALGDVPTRVLADLPGASGPPTLDALCVQITAEPAAILHIVCHGVIKVDTGETLLYLSAADGDVQVVTGAELIARLARIPNLPPFAFLSACNTAAPEREGALGGLAQRLVRELGMPAVVAMTEPVTVSTALALSAAFYARLRAHGTVDLALAEAWAGLDRRSDRHVPALFTRLAGRPLFTEAPPRVARFFAASPTDSASDEQHSADSLELSVARYRCATLARLPLPPLFGTRAQALSLDDLMTLFIEPMLCEPKVRRARRDRHPPDETPPHYRPPWAWRESLPALDHPGLLLLGDAGTGKSTALRVLARRYCQDGRLVPIFVHLPYFAEFARTNAANLRSYAEHHSPELAGEPFQALDQERRFLWILDGLDEVLDPSLRIRVTREVELLVRGDGKPRLVVVGSRPLPDPRLSAQFIRHELAPWDDDSVERLVRRYHQAVHRGPEGAQRAEALLRSLRTIPTLRELCMTPIVLGLVLSLDRVEVPWPRPHLYRETIQRVLDGEHVDDALLFLGRVAWDMLQRRQLTISRDRLLEIATTWYHDTFGETEPPAPERATALIERLSQRGTIFLPGDEGHLTFAHRIWYDYSAALEIYHRHPLNSLPTLFASCWDDPLWYEPLLLTAGLIADQHATDAIPLLRSVLCARVTLAQWNIAPSLLFVIQALGYCRKLRHEPLATLARAVTEFTLGFYEDVGSGFARALREAGPQWPGADVLRRSMHPMLALAVCDADSRIVVLLRHLPLHVESHLEPLPLLSFSRRLGPWTDDEVGRLLSVPLRERPDLEPAWPSLLRVHIAMALLTAGPAPRAHEDLEITLHASSPELRVYASLALLSLGKEHEEALTALEAAVQEQFWPDYVPSPMRIFLWHAAEQCRARLPDVVWQRIHAALSASSSRQLNYSATVPAPDRHPTSEDSVDLMLTMIRRSLDMSEDTPLSEENIRERIFRLEPLSAAYALDSVVTEALLPTVAWRSLAMELQIKFESYYAARQDWRSNSLEWSRCADHANAVVSLSTLLGERDMLQRLVDDERHEDAIRNHARALLEFGEHYDALIATLDELSQQSMNRRSPTHGSNSSAIPS